MNPKNFLIKIFILIFLTSCKPNRHDEYSCFFSDGSGPDFLDIKKDTVIRNKGENIEKELDIAEESRDRIIFYSDYKTIENTEYTFYKKTKKFKISYKTGKKEIYILDCEKLN